MDKVINNLSTTCQGEVGIMKNIFLYSLHIRPHLLGLKLRRTAKKIDRFNPLVHLFFRVGTACQTLGECVDGKLVVGVVTFKHGRKENIQANDALREIRIVKQNPKGSRGFLVLQTIHTLGSFPRM